MAAAYDCGCSFQLLTCVAIPIAYVKLNTDMKKAGDIFHVPCGRILSGFVYLLVSYLIIQSGLKAVAFSLIIHVILFVVYALSYYRTAKGVKKHLHLHGVFSFI